MTTALNEALTLTPDMGTILQDPDVRIPLTLPVLLRISWWSFMQPQVLHGSACTCCCAGLLGTRASCAIQHGIEL